MYGCKRFFHSSLKTTTCESVLLINVLIFFALTEFGISSRIQIFHCVNESARDRVFSRHNYESFLRRHDQSAAVCTCTKSIEVSLDASIF